MATRETRLKIGVDVIGQGDITALAADIDRLKIETAAAAQVSKEAAAVEAAAVADRRAARDALNAERDALSLLRIENTGAARATDTYRQAETALLLAVREKAIAVRSANTAVAEAGAAALAAARAEAELLAQADRVAKAYRETAAAASVAAREQQASAGSVSAALGGIKGQLETLRNLAGVALGGSLIGSLAKEVADVADGFNNLQARIKLVTGGGPALASAFQGVLDVAQRTNSSLENTGTLFTRILESGKAIGLGQRDALQLTESINQAIAISGTSAQSSDAAITQLIQGLQSGVLRGDEFNSVMEQAPRLAQAMADGLGVTKGELRKLAEQGTLTSQAVIGALQGQSQALQKEFGQLPATVGRAITNLSTAWTVYIGETDKATGASSKAASAINLLASNLDTLGSLLYAAGKTAAALAAVNLAKGFLDSAAAATQAAAATTVSTAATVTATRATVADTAARTANTAATLAGAEAATVAAGSTGRFASAVSSIKTFALVAVLTNLETLGTAIGESTAKLFGYGKSVDALDAALRKEAETTRAASVAKAALAQQTQQASDKALGLTDAARKLVGEFDGVRAKGESVADAMGKLTKSLELGDLAGITAAGAALDALAVKGKISGDQVREALATALKGEDLLIFETKAKAAFGNSEQGARRLKAALDAITEESLRRAGTSVEELKTGFSTAMNSALNDTDTLKRSLDELGVKGAEAGRLLSTSLDKALETATTERAVQAVIDRWQALGDQGKVTGDALAAGLDKARAKLDELKPGINSLDEALRSFGLKTRDELTATANKLGDSYRVIAASVTTSLADKIKAFEQYRETAIAANGGVETSEVALQRRILEAKAEAAGLGDEFEKAMSRADDALGKTRGRVRDLGAAINTVAGSLSETFSAATAARSASVSATKLPGATYDASGYATGADGSRLTAVNYTPPPDNSGNWVWKPELNQNINGGEWIRPPGYQEKATAANRTALGFVPNGFGGWMPGPGAGATTTPTGSGSGPTTVNITVGGRKSTVNVASQADADVLAGVLARLEDSAAAGG